MPAQRDEPSYEAPRIKSENKARGGKRNDGTSVDAKRKLFAQDDSSKTELDQEVEKGMGRIRGRRMQAVKKENIGSSISLADSPGDRVKKTQRKKKRRRGRG